MSDTELDPVESITVGTIGEPGSRTFMIQALKGADQLSVVLEKTQVVALGREVFDLLGRIGFPERTEATEAGEIDETNAPAWRVGTIAIAYEQERDLIMVEMRESVPEEGDEGARARLWVTKAQFLALGTRAFEVAAQGRPTCPYCWQPIDPDGHFCIRSNGHAGRAQA